MALTLPNSTEVQIARLTKALYDAAPGYTYMTAFKAEVDATSMQSFANWMAGTLSTDPDTLGAAVAANLHLTGDNATLVSTYLSGQFAANPDNQGQVLLEALNAYATFGDIAQFSADVAYYNNSVSTSYNYSMSDQNTSMDYPTLMASDEPNTAFALTTGVDNLIGTSADETFNAFILDNANTLQSGDVISGGEGTDTLNADIGDSQNFAITGHTTGIETVSIRAQSSDNEEAENNVFNQDGVNIDAQRMAGVTTWESMDSRADVIIEDVRVNSNLSTIAFVQSDPGNVDMAVYFNQRNLVNTAGGSSSLNLQVMDTVATAAGEAPLLNSTYGSFTFVATKAGVDTTITLASDAIQDAQTYEEMRTAFQAALDAELGAGSATATIGSNFTVQDPDSGTNCTGQTIVLTTADPAYTFSTPAGSGSGWEASGVAPAASNFYTNWSTGSDSTNALVNTDVILDDVGMGSTGGDLLIGGMSAGVTSTSLGVQRFNIEVRDNSKLQTINSTNNSLREVAIVNGLTSSSSTAYVTTTTDAGNLTVNGTVSGLLVPDAALVGAGLEGATTTHSGAGAAGFTDVRLIDASEMRGKFAFTAAITVDTLAKYVTRVDTDADPAADVAAENSTDLGANFIYQGGTNNDTMVVTIDGSVASSNSNTISGLSDFTFDLTGGAGNDSIRVSVIDGDLDGGAQAWYNNQKLNANISIDAGDGNDTIRTPGAGDVIIDAGAGDDTVYTDNTGSLVAAPNATGIASLMGTAYRDAAAAELAAGLAANVASNSTGFVLVDGTINGTAVTATARATALNNLDLSVPVDFASVPARAAITAAITAATNAGGLTLAQDIALNAAYGNVATTASVITESAVITAPDTITVGGAALTATVSQAQFDAGNALLATYITAADAAVATADSNDTAVAAGAPYDATGGAVAAELLNVSQKAVVVATQAVNRVFDPTTASNLVFSVGAITQGEAVATEKFTATFAATVDADSITFDGLAAHALGAAATAAANSLDFVTWYNLQGARTWNAVDNGDGTATFTNIAAGDQVDILTADFVITSGGAGANTSVTAAAPTTQGNTAVTESAAVTITGTGSTGETITFDGVTHNVAGLTATAIATLIDGEATDTTWTDGAAGAVVTFTGVAAATNIADITSASFTSNMVPVTAGTQVIVNGLSALSTVLNTTGTTDIAVVNALQTAVNNGSITATQASSLFTAATAVGVNSMVAADIAAVNFILTPLQTAATVANTAAQATLTDALEDDATAVGLVAAAVGLNPTDSVIANAASPIGGDEAGTAQTAAALATATGLRTAAAALVAELTTTQTALSTVKAAIQENGTDLSVLNATIIAAADPNISAGDKTAIDNAATTSNPLATGTVSAAEKLAADVVITALERTNNIALAEATLDLAKAAATVTATTLANTEAIAAAASGGNSLTLASPTAVYTFNTTDQTATYNNGSQDDRNLADLNSDANNIRNFYNSDVTVTYKGLTATVTVEGSNYQTSDLQINQAIKEAINNDAQLSKLLTATDGPANSLVVTSLIDGVHTTANLAVTVTMPDTGGSASDVAAAAAAWGMPAGTTDAQIVAAMDTAKNQFDAKGDYRTAFAEAGTAGGNTVLTGANSTAVSDNTVTPGDGDDMIVLGTTVGTDLTTSSNEIVVYNSDFGNDTIVEFAATGLGRDELDFTAINGSGNVQLDSVSLDNSIVIGNATATPLTATQIAALFTDSATAIDHVYVAVDTQNIGSIWMVADAAGTAAGNITVSLTGTIDLADTPWGSITQANFV